MSEEEKLEAPQVEETKKESEPKKEEIDYKKEFYALLKTIGSLGVQLTVLRENTENKIAQLEQEQKS